YQVLFVNAESGGFEPADLLQSTVFKTAAIDHSASSPGTKVQIRPELASGNFTFFNILLKR
ncbi:MAG: hypothetical protein JWR50_1586, partial [Mucilaginibacter sp.]|nr:hypothetical protein [Mucilaginibacter sp.]